jgi:hypothetical protein
MLELRQKFAGILTDDLDGEVAKEPQFHGPQKFDQVG